MKYTKEHEWVLVEGDTGTIRQGTGTVSWKFPGVGRIRQLVGT